MIRAQETHGATGSGGDDIRRVANIGAALEVNKAETHQLTHQLQGEISIHEMSRETLIELVRTLRRESAGYRTKAKEAEENAQQHSIAANRRIIAAEMRVAAVNAGIVDIEAWIFIDLEAVTLNAEGILEGADKAIASLKQQKPFLFHGGAK